MSITPYRAKAIALLAIIGMLLMPVPVALANGMPPLRLWLDFEYKTSEQPELEGVQLISCDTPECNKPTLLHEYGTCDAGGCLDSPPSLKAVQPLECLGDRCVVVFHNTDDGAIPPFKVVGQFSDRVRESTLFSYELSRYGAAVWRIAVQETALTVSVSNRAPQDRYHPYFGSFFQYFAFTIVAELLVAAVALGVWPKLRGRNFLIGLGYVLLANLISYPVTWIVFPSLGRFQPIVMRQTGVFIILIALVFTASLVNVSRKEGNARRRWLILTLVLVSLLVMATSLCWLAGGLRPFFDSGGRFAVSGLPSGLSIAFAEAFAVSFEALLFYLLARKTLALSFKQAALISLVMNAASFLAGLVLSAWL